MSPADVAAHIEKEISRWKAEGLISTNGEAEARKQMGVSMTQYVSNVSTGVVTEFYYPPAFRLDWKIFRGTNSNVAQPKPDRDFGYIVLDQSAMKDIPIIEVSYAGRSLVKSRVRSLSTKPVLKGALEPNVNCATMVALMLINTNTPPKSFDRSSLVFSPDRAEQMLRGSHSSQFRLTVEKVVGDDRDVTRYRFNKPEKLGKPTVQLLVEIATCGGKDRVRHLVVDLRPNFFIEDIIDYNLQGHPTSFNHSERSVEGDGHEYRFDHIEIKNLEAKDFNKTFFIDYPKTYFCEEETATGRILLNNPYSRPPIVPPGRPYISIASMTSTSRATIVKGILLVALIGPLIIFLVASRSRARKQ